MEKDEVHIQSVIAGDREAFRHLVVRYQDYVFSIVLGVLKSRQEAEEVAQDVFLKVYQALPGFTRWPIAKPSMPTAGVVSLLFR